MEEHLGRKLREGEVVHHINHAKDDNRIENLRLMTASEHSKVHHPELPREMKPCELCGQMFGPRGRKVGVWKRQRFCSLVCSNRAPDHRKSQRAGRASAPVGAFPGALGATRRNEMGYTHYWRVRRDTDASKLAEVRDDVGLLLANSPVPLGDGHGRPGTEPKVIDGRVFFNGIDDSANVGEDLAHETFSWPPDLTADGWTFDFCKTARKPYDAVVAASLIRAKKILGADIEVSSDGSETEFLDGPGDYYGEVESARHLYERTFDEPAFSPLREEDA